MGEELCAEGIATLVAALGVSEARARQLLEAVGGCVERAADLQLSQQGVPEALLEVAAVEVAQPQQVKRPRSAGQAGTFAAEQGRRSWRRTEKGLGAPNRTLATFFKQNVPPDEAALVEDDPSAVGATSTPSCGVAEGAVSSTAVVEPSRGTGDAMDFFVKKPGQASESHSSEPASKQSIPYSHLSAAFARLCATSKRKEKESILLEAFTVILQTSPKDLVPAVCLSSNTLGPPWEGLDLGVGGSAIVNAVSAATGASHRELSALWKRHGDAGDVAAAVRARQRLLAKPETLTISRVFETLLSISAMSGEGCTAKRVRAMAGLVRAAEDAEETRFLVRTFARHIRTQATLTTVKDAAVAAVAQQRLAAGHANDPPAQELQRLARECFTACPDVRRVLEPLLRGGVPAMRKACAFSVGTPMRPMLARAETSVEAVLRDAGAGALTCEHKYDGQRAQIHRDTVGCVRLFSRHLEDMTSKYPDVVGSLGTLCLKDGMPRPFVLDAEIVAANPEGEAAEEGADKALHTDAFQRLSTRKRKDVTVGSIEVKVKVFAFDLLFLDGVSLISSPFRERRDRLHEAFEQSATFDFASFADVAADDAAEPAAEPAAQPVPVDGAEANDARPEAVQHALERALADGCEGLMCKLLDAPYEPSDGSRRSPAWLKLKADYIEGMGDSLDLVPIGGWHGMGRKAKWISPFLLACWDPNTESLQSVCRVMTGFTDAFYKEKTAFYLGANKVPEANEAEECDDDTVEDVPHQRDGPDPRVITSEVPPLWFEPCEVWEVRGASLSLSPKHKAAVGLLHPDRGLSMRFPRFIRTRPDKAVHDATTSAQLAEMFHAQQARGGGNKAASSRAPGEEEASDHESDLD